MFSSDFSDSGMYKIL